MTATTQIRQCSRPFAGSTTRNLLRAVLLLLLCSNPLAARQNDAPAPETVTIKLPYDGPAMRFKAVYLGIEKKPLPRLFASRRFQLGSRDDPSKQTYKQQRVSLDLAGAFIGRRNGQSDWLYYLGETEVSRGQWNRVMRWMDEQEGKTPAAKLDASQAKFPQNNITIARVYRFIEALNTWMLQQQKNKLPRIDQSYAFARLPTEAEWAFAARGGINVLNDPDTDRFDRPHPYTKELGKYEWHSKNIGNKLQPQECGSNDLANPIGLQDMLGNVEELTISLFGPQYVHGRLGQFVIRGNSFKDAPKAFDISCRTEFVSHDPDGKLISSGRNMVGFRLALSSSISASEESLDVLDEECKHYIASLESKEPRQAGETPATQAEQNSKKDCKSAANECKADIKYQKTEILRLQGLRNKDHAVLAETKQDNIDLRDRNERLEVQVADFHKQLSKSPTLDAIALKKQLKQSEVDIQNLKDRLQHAQEKSNKLEQTVQHSPGIEKINYQELYTISEKHVTQLMQQIEELRQKIAEVPPAEESEQYKQHLARLQDEKKVLEVKLADLNLTNKQVKKYSFDLGASSDELSQELEQKKQRVADLERRLFARQDKIAENAKLTKIAEKRYLEALMRQAYTNAYNAYVQLVKRQEIYLPEKGPAAQKKAEKAYSQACQFIHDYWKLVVKMAEETQADFFPDVKQELSVWLKGGEETDHFSQACRTGNVPQLLSPVQRKSLDLIERHVKRVRAGGSRLPDDLISTFIDQPEFQ